MGEEDSEKSWLMRQLERDEKLSFKNYMKFTIQEAITPAEEELCSQCYAKQQMYCVECDKVFCKACIIRVHHPGNRKDSHSLEEIVEEVDQGIKIITPMLEELLLVGILGFVFSHHLIKEDYLYSGDVCILTNYAKSAFVHFDDKAFHMFKTNFAAYCNVEDSYWRLFLDFWVRDVVTDSDSFFLLLTSFGPALGFAGALGVVVVPVLATLFALAFGILAKLESMLPKTLNFLKVAQKIVKKLNFLDFAVDEEDECPPLTKRRRRMAKSYYEGLWYEQNRILREFSFFFMATANVLQKILTWPMFIVFGIRAISVVLNLGPFWHWICFHIWPGTLLKHAQWFGIATQHEYTDLVIRAVASQLWEKLQVFLGFAAGAVGEGVVASVPLFMFTSQYLALPLAYFGTCYGLRKLRHFQEWKFGEIWVRSERIRVRGDCPGAICGDKCKCDCIQKLYSEEE